MSAGERPQNYALDREASRTGEHTVRVYRVSHELRSLLRESVPMLKYTDITQNTYIQS